MNYRNKALSSFILIHIFLLYTSAVLFAQDEEYEIYKEIRETRTLGNHYFTPNNTLKYPFILTHVNMSLGIGSIADIRFPLIEVGGEEYVYLQGDITAALLEFEYQHAVKDWLAVFIGVGMIGRLGSDFGTFLLQGLNYSTNFNLGWMIKVYSEEKFALSTSVSLANGNYSIININKFINDIIDNVPNASITVSNNSLLGLWGGEAAYGFTQFIGVNVLAELGYGETIQRVLENKWFTNFGINADMNFSHIIEAPLSLSMGYFFSSYPQNNNDVLFNTNKLFAQFSYIGRSNFILSLDLSRSREIAGTYEETIWLNTTEFSMRYLF